MTYKQAYEMGSTILEKAGIEDAALDARLLLEFVCDTNRSYLLAHGEETVSEEKEKRYTDYVSKRMMHVPLQHIVGEQEFMGLSFLVNEHVLIPRQDTEFLVEEVLRYLHDGMKLLDVCTGSGCILLSLLKYSNHCTGVGLDISKEALLVAKENQERLGITAQFLQSDLFSVLEGKEKKAEGCEPSGEGFDIIVSNPPYIETQVIPTLSEEVKSHEPRLALDGGEDGLDFYRSITREAGQYLNRGGMLFFEIGHNQGGAVVQILKEYGYEKIQLKKDYAGLDRVVFGTFLEGKHV